MQIILVLVLLGLIDVELCVDSGERLRLEFIFSHFSLILTFSSFIDWLSLLESAQMFLPLFLN